MKSILIISLLLLSYSGSAQFLNNACYDSTGIIQGPDEYYFPTYRVKKNKKKTQISIHVKSITYGETELKMDVVYEDKIEAETPIIPLNDTLAIKVVLGKVTENNNNFYLYKSMIFKLDKETNCWGTLGYYNTFYYFHSQLVNLSGSSVGYEGDSGFFKINEGWIELNKKPGEKN